MIATIKSTNGNVLMLHCDMVRYEYDQGIVYLGDSENVLKMSFDITSGEYEYIKIDDNFIYREL